MARKISQKQQSQLMIALVAFIMLGSAAYYGFRSSISPSQDNEGEQLPIRYATARPIGDGPITVEVAGMATQVVAQPLRPEILGRDDVENILLDSYPDVSSVELETTSSYTIIIFNTIKPVEVAKQLSTSLKVPGGFNVYPVHYGSTEFGETDLLGPGLEVGDKVEVLLMQKGDQNFFSLIGFVSKKVEASQASDLSA